MVDTVFAGFAVLVWLVLWLSVWVWLFVFAWLLRL